MTTHADQIRSYFKACSSGSGEAVATHFTDDAVIYDTNHSPIVSSTAIGEFWSRIHDKWVGSEWIVEQVIETIDAAAIEWVMKGEAEEQPFKIRGSEHYEFKGHLIAEIRQYWTFDPESPGGGLIEYPYGEPDRLGFDD